MIEIIAGEKGKGKTKVLLDKVNEPGGIGRLFQAE